MTRSALSVLALGRLLRLKGFEASVAYDGARPDNPEPSASSAALAAGRKAGLKDFAPKAKQQASRPESAIEVAIGLRLPGFAAESPVPVVAESTKAAPAANARVPSALGRALDR